MKNLYTLFIFVFFHILIIQGLNYNVFNSKSIGADTLIDIRHDSVPNKYFSISHFPKVDNNNSEDAINHQTKVVKERSISAITGIVQKENHFIPSNSSIPINKTKEDNFAGIVTVGKVGTGCDYTSLTGSGGLFDKLNTGQVNGNLTVIIKTDLTETGNIALNAWPEGPGGPYTVVIQPEGSRIINTTYGLRLNGSRRVKIDGLNDGTNSLSIIKSGAGTDGAIEFLNGASNNTITRLSICGNNSYDKASVITLYSNNSSSPLNNNTISYCRIFSSETTPLSSVTYCGIYFTTYNPTNVNGTLIDHNTLINFSDYSIHKDDNIYSTNTIISNNEIYNTVGVGRTEGFAAISFQKNIGKTNIFNNKIHDILCRSGISTTTGVSAMDCYTSAKDTLNVYNNLIYLDATVKQGGLIYSGIKLYDTGTTNLNYNTIYIGDSVSTTNNSYGINMSGYGKTRLLNNIIYNSRSKSTGTGKHYGIYIEKTISSDKNDIFVYSRNGYLGFSGVDRLNLRDWITATKQDSNSVSIDPLFISKNNYTPLNTALNIGTPIAGITKDINGASRSTITPTVGAYEFICLNPVNGGTIAADQTIPANSKPALITSTSPATGNSGTLEYKWQNAVSPFTTWSDIPTSNSLAYQPNEITETMYFKRLARSGCNDSWTGAAVSNVVTITISINKWKGNISNDWSNPGNWTDNVVPATDANLVFDDYPIRDCIMDKDLSLNNITKNQSTYHLVTNGKLLVIKGKLNLTQTPLIDASAQNSIILFSGITSQSIPSGAFYKDSVYNMTINNASGIMLNADLNITKLLTINPGSQLTIPTERMLNVSGMINNLAGNSGLVIKASPTGIVPNGSLTFQNNTTTDPFVPATVEMYTKASLVNGSYRWQFFGIPLKSIQANPTFSGSYVREMYENVVGTTGHWVQLQNESVLRSFTGYEITQLSGKVITFEGILENANYSTMQLSYSPEATYKGQHLIGNPYTAAINIKNTGTPANSLNFGDGVDKTVYLYNTGSKNDWSSNGANGGGDMNTAGQYMAVPQENAGTDILPASIPSMQAFLIMVNNSNTATLSIPYGSTGTIVKSSTLQRINASKKIYTRIDVNGSSYGDRMWLFTEPTCTRGFDNGWDGTKLFGSILAPQLYAMEADGDYQVNSVDNINNTYLGFKAGIDTSYTLTFTHKNTDTHYQNIFLVDSIDNKIVDITSSGSQYSFIPNNSLSIEKRFKIIATTSENQVSTDIIPSKKAAHSLTVFSSNQTILVHNQSSLKGNLLIYDLAGRFIQRFQFSAQVTTLLPVHLPKGSYLSKAITMDDEISTMLIFR